MTFSSATRLAACRIQKSVIVSTSRYDGESAGCSLLYRSSACCARAPAAGRSKSTMSASRELSPLGKRAREQHRFVLGRSNHERHCGGFRRRDRVEGMMREHYAIYQRHQAHRTEP